MAEILCGLLYAYIVIIFARVVLSWFPIEPGSGLAQVYGFLYSITEPVMGPIRRIIPPIGGGMPLDLSPIIVVAAIYFLRGAIC